MTGELSISVLYQEMPPFQITDDVMSGVIQEGPETSPTVSTIGCTRVVQGEAFKGYTLRPATIYAAGSVVGIAG